MSHLNITLRLRMRVERLSVCLDRVVSLGSGRSKSGDRILVPVLHARALLLGESTNSG